MMQQAIQDEILVKFPDGTFKILQGGVFHDPQGTPSFSSLSSPPQLDQTARIAEQILHTSGITVDPALRNRALLVIASSLKGLRSRIQAKDAFMKPPTEGGLGLNDAHTETILKIIKEKLSVPVVPSKSISTPPTNLPVVSPPPPVPQLVIPQSSSLPSSASQKPRLVLDVRPPIKLVSPAEELSMSLVDFRRISGNPYEAIKSILEKIATLGAQSFTKKLDGIQAWQQSEVVRIYAAVVEASIAGHLPYEDVIAAAKKQGKPMLSKEEFLAVIELNKSLRF